jgi:hypothetical protein
MKKNSRKTTICGKICRFTRTHYPDPSPKQAFKVFHDYPNLWAHLMKVIPEVRRAHKKVTSTFVLLTLGRYFCWWVISPRGYHPLSSRGTNMALTWLIRYMYCRNLQFLNNVIKNKANVLLPQTYITVTDSGYPIQAFCLYCFQSLLLFGLTIFRF